MCKKIIELLLLCIINIIKNCVPCVRGYIYIDDDVKLNDERGREGGLHILREMIVVCVCVCVWCVCVCFVYMHR